MWRAGGAPQNHENQQHAHLILLSRWYHICLADYAACRLPWLTWLAARPAHLDLVMVDHYVDVIYDNAIHCSLLM